MTEPTAAWRCGVCGYVHRAGEAPEFCPVCGAARAEFQPYTDVIAPPPAAARWRCLNCSHVHDAPDPPEVCPVCGAPADCFEAIPAAASTDAAESTGHVVVVGAGIAGVSAVESISRAAPKAHVTLIGRESALPNYRLNLTRYLAGEISAADLPIHPQSWYDNQGVELLLGSEAAELGLDDRAVVLRDGKRLPFDALVLTVGAHPFIPPLPGSTRDSVVSLRTADDAERITAAVTDGVRCVCIGGGLLGLETAGALAKRGAAVTLLEGHGHLMPRQLCPRAGERLAEHVAAAGITLETNARTEQIVGDERAAGVELTDGRTIPAELVVIATGVRPNSHLARRAGLDVGAGVIVDNHLRTGADNVFAAGDVAEHRGSLYGNWAASQYQGGIAGLNAVGVQAEFGGIPRSNALKVLGVELMSIGTFEPEDASYLVVEGEDDQRYARFVFHDGRLVGAILLGDASAGGTVKQAIETRADFSGLLSKRPEWSDVVEDLSGH